MIYMAHGDDFPNKLTELVENHDGENCGGNFRFLQELISEG